MKKIFIFLVLLLVILIPVMAVNGDSLSSDEFEIKGYKITSSDSSVEFVITDAISESLNTFSESDLGTGYIDATNHMDSFLSDTADISADNVDNIIFSYRLVASGSTSYTISFNITPFTDGKGNTVDAAFKTDHHNLVYSDDGSQPDEEDEKEKFTIMTTNADSTVVPSSNTEHKNADLSGAITPPSGNSRQWIFRGAVLMAVSRWDYDAAPRGRYTSRVTATLTIN